MFTLITKKSYWLSLIAVLAFVSFFALIQIGIRSSLSAKELPIAIVNKDEGPLGEQLEEKLIKKFEATDDAKIKLIRVDSSKKLNQGFNDKKYYGALVIDQSFSADIAQEQTLLKQAIVGSADTQNIQNLSAKLEIKINEGMNATGAGLATTVLTQLATSMNTQISQNQQELLSSSNAKLPVSFNSILNNPVSYSVSKINPIPEDNINGMLPFLSIMLAWMGSLVMALLLSRIHHPLKAKMLNMKVVTSQIVSGLLGAIAIGLLVSVFMKIFSVTIPDFSIYTLAISSLAFVFYLIQSALVNWLGMAGMGIATVMFMLSTFSTYPIEMLNHFMQTYIMNWLPIRYAVDLITNLLYFENGSGTTQTSVTVILIYAIVAIALMYLSIFKSLFKGVKGQPKAA